MRSLTSIPSAALCWQQSRLLFTKRMPMNCNNKSSFVTFNQANLAPLIFLLETNSISSVQAVSINTLKSHPLKCLCATTYHNNICFFYMEASTSSTSTISGDQLVKYFTTVAPVPVEGRIFEATTDIGLRPTQEDRFVLVPTFFRDDAAFCGVFDGTVGDDASDFIVKNVVDFLCRTEEISDTATGIFACEPTGGSATDIAAEKIRSALRQTFLGVDQALIAMCTEKKLHYASSTGVAAFLWRNLLTVAHVGDSKACIARQVGDEIHPEWLTVDHKPNMPNELKRIEQCGGSLAWLHGNKPYIRGGDFFRRQAAGEHPKQLNYSRAFGGKDLKMFGLSAEPDISHFEVSPDDRLVLLASDGLWDVLNPRTACEIAMRSRREGRSATKDIVAWAIEEMPACGVRDNITVIAIFLNEA